MYNRYGDISKFIIDMKQLCIADDGYVYVSKEEDHGIAVDMESCYGSLEPKNIHQLDEIEGFLIFAEAFRVKLEQRGWELSCRTS